MVGDEDDVDGGVALRRERAAQVEALNGVYAGMRPYDIIEHALREPLFSNPTVVSSFGAESAVLLHMIARIRPSMPVHFIDTGKLFDETLRFRDRLQHALGLENVRCLAPSLSDLRAHDPDGTLHRRDPDQCCRIRKTLVLERALGPFDSWINGRKRFQSELRALMPIVEFANGRAKLNPLANWRTEDIKRYSSENNLPIHPLVAQGYYSIGCFPCTSKVAPDVNPRAGRWTGLDKSECGIHTE
ncbi:MAG: phosphoadenylyl-sulfate reductase [Gammaproteobacteria bacterium]